MSDLEFPPMNFFDELEKIQQRIKGKRVLLFLDYDGTLTPIVKTPDLAVISSEMRELVRQASQVTTVSIVSGRATDDVREKVGIKGIFYAGSHGFEIVDPHGRVTINEEAKKVKSVIAEVHTKLSKKLEEVRGALVENVKYTISCHYRLVSDKDVHLVEFAVNKVLQDYPSLRKTDGKKVFEIRPRIDWDKGKAVEWIMDYLGYDRKKDLPVYVGDDTTDEDAFRVLKGRGIGIFVSNDIRPSEAEYIVNDTSDVRRILKFFLETAKEVAKKS